MPPSIFISYNHKNSRLVDILADDLETAGYTVWFDRENTGGQQWWNNILARIRENDVFLPALTRRYLDSNPCMKEFEYAVALDKNILPVVLSDLSLAQLPSELQSIHIETYQQHTKQEALKLIKALHKLPDTTPLPDPLPQEPEIPLAPHVQIGNELKLSQFEGHEQASLLEQIKKLLKDNPSSQEAYDLLELFRTRQPDKLLAYVEQEISHLLEQRPQSTNRGSILLEPRTFVGHRGEVTGVAFSKDNRYIFSGSHDFTARQWDSVTGEEVRRFRGHDGKITCMDFHAESEILLTGSEDESARLWEINSGNEISKFDGHKDTLVSVGFSKEMNRLFTADSTGMIKIWDTDSLECTAIIETGERSRNADISHDGLLIVLAPTETRRPKISVWSVETGELWKELSGHQDFINEVSFSPDGKYVLSSSNDKTTRLWDLKTGLMHQPFVGHRHQVYSNMFSSDGEYIFSGGIGESSLWKIGADEPLITFQHPGVCNCMAISDDQQYALIGTDENTIFLRETGLIVP